MYCNLPITKSMVRSGKAFSLFFCILFISKGTSLNAVTVTAVGDIFISKRMIENRTEEISKLKLKGDIVIGNFEGVLSENPEEKNRLQFRLEMPYEIMSLLKKMCFNTLSLANNHIFDNGETGYKKTVGLLRKNNFKTIEYDSDGIKVERENVSIRIIPFTFSGKNNVNNIEDVKRTVSKYHEDIIIISAHMGGERREQELGEMEYFGSEKRGNLRKFSRACIDSGADLVIGHGSHTLRSVEYYKDRLILYSLGNFIFDYPGSEKKKYRDVTCSMSIILDGNGRFVKARVSNYNIDRGIPVRDPRNRAFKRLYYLSRKYSSIKGLSFSKNLIINKNRSRKDK